MARNRTTAKRQLPSEEREEDAHHLSLYCPAIHVKQGYELRLLGLSQKQIAKVWDVSEDSIERWRKRYPAFAKSWNDGSEIADGPVVVSLRKRAIGYEVPVVKTVTGADGKVERTEKTTLHIPPEPGAARAYLAARHPDIWSERRKTELSGPQGKPIQVDSRSPRDILLERIRGITARHDAHLRHVIDDPRYSDAQREAARLELQLREVVENNPFIEHRKD